MSIEPHDIERAVFKERFRGYDPDQVDRFLDDVAAGVEALAAERDSLAAQLEALHADTAPAPAGLPGEGVDRLLQRTLQAAQRTADELVADARRQGQEIIEDAQRRAQRDRDQVRSEAALVRKAVSELSAFRDEYRARLHAVLSEQLSVLDRVGELPRLPASVDSLGEAEVIVRREPSLAGDWASAAAAEPEPSVEEVAAPEAPWDELWHDASAPGETSVLDDDGGFPDWGGVHDRAGDA